MKQNPTYYRSPQDYNSMLLQGTNSKHTPWDFKLIKARNLQTYVKVEMKKQLVNKLKDEALRLYVIIPGHSMKVKNMR